MVIICYYNGNYKLYFSNFYIVEFCIQWNAEGNPIQAVKLILQSSVNNSAALTHHLSTDNPPD